VVWWWRLIDDADSGRRRLTLFPHVAPIVDDRTRLAYVELHDDEKAKTVTGFVQRALAFFAAHGIVAKRPMTDNAFNYSRTVDAASSSPPTRSGT
jgi:hypothetical protein